MQMYNTNQITKAGLTILSLSAMLMVNGCATTSSDNLASSQPQVRTVPALKLPDPVASQPTAMRMEKVANSSVIIHDLSETYSALLASATEFSASTSAKANDLLATMQIKKQEVEAFEYAPSEINSEKKAAIKQARLESKVPAPFLVQLPSEKMKEEMLPVFKPEQAWASTMKTVIVKSVAVQKTEPMPATVQITPAQEVYFSVQFLTYDLPLLKGQEKLKGVSDFQLVPEGHFYKYFTGKTRTFEAASDLQQSLRVLGFRDAFVVAFKNGTKVPVLDAIRELSIN